MGRDTDFDYGHAARALGFDSERPHFCGGNVKCSKCGKPYGVCCEVENQLMQGGNYMLPKPGAQNNGQGQQGGGGGRQRSGLPYVNESNLSLDKKRCRVLAVKLNDAPVREGQRRFSDVIVKFAMGGDMYLLGLKTDNPNYEILCKAFGEDDNRWLEREFFMYLEEDDFDKRRWVRVEPITGDEGEEDKPEPPVVAARKRGQGRG